MSPSLLRLAKPTILVGCPGARRMTTNLKMEKRRVTRDFSADPAILGSVRGFPRLGR